MNYKLYEIVKAENIFKRKRKIYEVKASRIRICRSK